MSDYSQSAMGGIKAYWWKQDENELHKTVFDYVNRIENSQSYKSLENLRYLRLYQNYEVSGLNVSDYAKTETDFNRGTKNRVTLNVIHSMCDTVTSKITKNKPKPTFLTDGGDFTLQNKAKKLQKFVEGQFSSQRIYEKASRAFLDSCIFGTGVLKFFIDRESKEIKCERVFVDEIIVDDAEAIYGEPRQIHQRKYIHKDVLKDMFPEHKGAIENSMTSGDEFNSGSSEHDMVKVIESWHLPSGPNAKDGKHAISIAGATLFEDIWDKPDFPFLFLKWTQRPLGFYGQGLAEQLQGIQLEINKILRTIQISMHLTSIPKVFLETSSKVVSAHINNEIGGIIKYAGTPPRYESVEAIGPALFSHLDRLYNRAFEIAGVSQLSAQSQKPSGLDSGAALREFNDIETERFMAIGQRYEQFFVDAARMTIRLAKELAEDVGDLSVNVKGGKFLETIKWKDVDMAEDKYLLDIFPTSSLPSTPSGRLQTIQEMLQAGLISREDGIKLLDFPDLQSVMNLQNAAIENIDKNIENMIDNGRYEPPEPYQNLGLLVKKTQEAYLFYKNQNAPEDRLELLRRYMDDANQLITRAQRQAQEQADAEAALQAQGSLPATEEEDALAQADADLMAEQPPLEAEGMEEEPV